MEYSLLSVYHCDFCQKDIYEPIDTTEPHYLTCVATPVLHSIIPTNLLNNDKPFPYQKANTIEPSAKEIFGANAATETFLPEPGLLICGYCKDTIPREFIAYHVLHCHPELSPSVAGKKMDSGPSVQTPNAESSSSSVQATGTDTSSSSVQTTKTEAVRIEFYFFFLLFYVFLLFCFLSSFPVRIPSPDLTACLPLQLNICFSTCSPFIHS